MSSYVIKRAARLMAITMHVINRISEDHARFGGTMHVFYSIKGSQECDEWNQFMNFVFNGMKHLQLLFTG